MSEPLTCPHCRAMLTDAEVVRLHRQYAAAQRKTRSGGHNGGRPPKYQADDLGVSMDDLPTNADRLAAARRHSNAVLEVGPPAERMLIPIDET